jgi:hypothetical protein
METSSWQTNSKAVNRVAQATRSIPLRPVPIWGPVHRLGCPSLQGPSPCFRSTSRVRVTASRVAEEVARAGLVDRADPVDRVDRPDLEGRLSVPACLNPLASLAGRGWAGEKLGLHGFEVHPVSNDEDVWCSARVSRPRRKTSGVRRGSHDPAGRPDRRSPALALASQAFVLSEHARKQGDLRSGTRASTLRVPGDPRTTNAIEMARRTRWCIRFPGR